MIALRLSGRFVCRQSRFQPSHEDHTPREFAGGNDPVVSNVRNRPCPSHWPSIGFTTNRGSWRTTSSGLLAFAPKR